MFLDKLNDNVDLGLFPELRTNYTALGIRHLQLSSLN
jgi:hypothetical protein